jgi:Cu+-exporting ATPase
MMEEACLIVYCPSVGAGQPALSLSPDVAGIRLRGAPESERASVVTLSAPSSGQADFRARVLSSLAAPPPPADLYVSRPLSATTSAALVRVEGMVCGSCVQLIEKTLPGEAGVHGVKVSLAGREAMVEFDPTTVTAQAVATAIDDMGFEAKLLSTHTAESIVTVPFQNGTGPGEGLKRVVIGVEGMVCQSCVSNIQSNVGRMSGVEDISVSLADKNASVTFDGSLVSVAGLCAAIEDLGFEASCEQSPSREPGASGEAGEGVRRCSMRIEGMTCHSCVSLVESAVRDLGGVVSMTVTLETKEGVVEYETGRVGEEEIRSAIEDTGFEVVSISGKSTTLAESLTHFLSPSSSSHLRSPSPSLLPASPCGRDPQPSFCGRDPQPSPCGRDPQPSLQ